MDRDVRFTARMYIDYYAAKRGISVEEIGVAPRVVVSWGPNVIEELAESIGAEPAEHWGWLTRFPLYTGEIGGRCVSFVQVGIGAPTTVTAMESLIACGARTFLGLGWAGSLQPSAPVGTLLIPTDCIREEGTSFHYLDADETVGPDEGLVALLQRAAEAVVGEEENPPAVLTGPPWTPGDAASTPRSVARRTPQRPPSSKADGRSCTALAAFPSGAIGACFPTPSCSCTLGARPPGRHSAEQRPSHALRPCRRVSRGAVHRERSQGRRER